MASRDTVYLDLDAIVVDAVEFRELADRGVRALARDPEAGIDALAAAEALFRGEFFAEEPYDERVEPLRNDLREVYRVGIASPRRACRRGRRATTRAPFAAFSGCSRSTSSMSPPTSRWWRRSWPVAASGGAAASCAVCRGHGRTGRARGALPGGRLTQLVAIRGCRPVVAVKIGESRRAPAGRHTKERTMLITLLVIVGIIVLLGLWAVGTHNGLITLRNLVQEAWRQIDVELKRRHDLIGNLVETVKGYAAHEQKGNARGRHEGARGDVGGSRRRSRPSREGC